MSVYYEFDIELFDLEYGDIQDHEFFATFQGGKQTDKTSGDFAEDFKKLYCTDRITWNTVGSEFCQGLQKSCGHINEQNLGERFCIVKYDGFDKSWAYLNLDGTLPNTFDCGSVIPKYVASAFEKLKSGANQWITH